MAGLTPHQRDRLELLGICHLLQPNPFLRRLFRLFLGLLRDLERLGTGFVLARGIGAFFVAAQLGQVRVDRQEWHHLVLNLE